MPVRTSAGTPTDPPITATVTRLARLAALLLILWFALVMASLAARDVRERSTGAWTPAPATADAEWAIPPLGVTVQWEGVEPEERQRALQRLKAGGIGWVRLRAGWETIEPEKSRFDWGELDAWLADIGHAGLEPVVVLDGSPEWAQSELDRPIASSLAPPARSADFAAFAGTLALRYANQVRFYQVWDEPNIAPHWGNRHIDPVGYAQLLIAAAAAIRAADQDARILTAALAPTRDRGHLAIDEPYFLQRMLAAGARGSFDAVAVQPFGFGHSPLHPRQQIDVLNFQRAAMVHRVLARAGLAGMPIWAVRFGWNTRGDSPWATVTATDQVRYAAEARAVARRWPWLVSLGWAVDRPNLPRDDPFWGFTLSDDVLAALAGPLPSLPAPDRAEAVWHLAGWAALAAAAAAALWRETRALPLRRWQQGIARSPEWLQATAWAALLAVYHLATPAPLIVACWLAGMLLVAARPVAGVWLALGVIPFYFQHKEVQFGLWQGAVPPLTAAILLLLPSIARALANPRGDGTLRARLIWTDSGAALWLLLNLLAAANVWKWDAYGRGLLELAVVPLLLYAAMRLFVTAEPASVWKALAALAAGGFLVACVGLVSWARGSGVEVDGVRRLVGPQFSPNHAALHLIRSLFLWVGLLLSLRGGVRRWGVLLVAAVGLALLLTASRGAIVLGLPAGFLLCFWFWTQRGSLPLGVRTRALLRRPSVRALLIMVPVVAVAAIAAGEARLFNRESVDSRLLLWQASVRLWQALPLTGAGPGGFAWSYPAFLPADTTLEPSLQHPHNVWLEVATGWGFFGLIWLAGGIAAWLVRSARRVGRLPAELQWPAIGLTAALVAALAHGQVDAFLVLPDLAAWLLAALALWGTLERTARPDARADMT